MFLDNKARLENNMLMCNIKINKIPSLHSFYFKFVENNVHVSKLIHAINICEDALKKLPSRTSDRISLINK